MVPKLTVNSRDVITMSVKNVGRTSVVVIRADLVCLAEPPPKPLPTFLTDNFYEENVVIGAEQLYVFGGGPMQIPHDNPECWICGGVIYQDVFGGMEVAGVAILLNRLTGKYKADWDVNFSEWEKLLKRLRKIKRGE